MSSRIDPSLSLDAALTTWRTLKGIGKRPRTLEFHHYITHRIRRHWPECLAKPVGEISELEVAAFAQCAQLFAAHQFNAAVHVVKAVVPAAWFLKRLPVRSKRVWLPSHADYARLLRELDNCRQGSAGLVVRLLALTGLRIGEARALVWSDIGPNGIIVPDSKTHEPRLIPFVGDCRHVLDRIKAANEGAERIVNVKSVRRALGCACKRAELPRLTHHGLRKLFATRCIECGVDVPTVSRWLGHKDGGALLGKTYFHLLDPHSKRMAAIVQITADPASSGAAGLVPQRQVFHGGTAVTPADKIPEGLFFNLMAPVPGAARPRQ